MQYEVWDDRPFFAASMIGLASMSVLGSESTRRDTASAELGRRQGREGEKERGGDGGREGGGDWGRMEMVSQR